MQHAERCPAMSTEPVGEKARASGDAMVADATARFEGGEQGPSIGEQHSGHRSGLRKEDVEKNAVSDTSCGSYLLDHIS